MAKKAAVDLDLLFSRDSTKKFSLVEISKELGLSEDSSKKKLNTAFVINPEIILQLTNFVPKAESLLAVAKSEFGKKITPDNFLELNKICKKWLDNITEIVHKNYLKKTLSENIKANTVSIELNDLNAFLLEDYSDFMMSVNNSLVSLTGTSTENIIIIGLESAGLEIGKDFLRKGKGFDADLKILKKKASSRGDDALYVEIKSFYAKERFSVALSSIKSNCKVGVGFFVDPKEFNPSATTKYLEIGVMAIYMPDDTYKKVSSASKGMLASNQSNLYRPISNFCADMKKFNQEGSIPDYKFKST